MTTKTFIVVAAKQLICCMQQTKWFEQKFDFNSQQNIFLLLLKNFLNPARLDENFNLFPKHSKVVK